MVAQRVDDSGLGGGERATGGGHLTGVPYAHEWIDAGAIEIDHRYQRPASMPWVRRIAAEFDPFLLDDLLVNRTSDGRLLVMDGQHRLLAIREMGWGDQRVPCKVYDNLPIELQAKRFNVQKARKALKPQEEFKAALEAREPGALEIERTVRDYGFRLNLLDGDLDGGQIVAVAALRQIARSHRVGSLGEVLGLVRDGFGTTEGPRHTVLGGLASFNSRFRGEYDRSRLVEVMRRTSLGRVTADGSDAARILGIKTGDGVAFALWKAYNHRLSDDRKLPDFSSADGRKKRQGAA